MKKNKIIIGCDLHNTLLLSNKAWIESFLSFNHMINEKEISTAIYRKKSRKELAKKYNIDYDKLINKYHNICMPNKILLDFIHYLNENNYPILLISSSNKEKVERDLLKIREYIKFDNVYTKEKFRKDNSKDWDKIIKKYDADMLIYIGNDYDEDIINNDKVVSLISGHFLKELKNNNILDKRGE